MRRQKNFGSMKCSKPAVETYFLLERTYGAENGPPFLDLQPCGAENGHRFLTCNPAAQKTAVVF